MTGGEARAIEPPAIAVRGVTTYDQRWIDETIEAGVQGLGWPRPAPRPPELDATPAQHASQPAKPSKPRTIRDLILRSK